MFSPRVLFCVIVVLIGMHTYDCAPVATYQVLPPRPGYIPVYIRKGDTPLEEINLELAEAFRSLEAKSNHQKDSPFVLTGIVEEGKPKINYIPRNNDILKDIDVEK